MHGWCTGTGEATTLVAVMLNPEVSQLNRSDEDGSHWCHFHLHICDRIWKNQPVSEKMNLSVRDAKVIQAEIAEFYFYSEL